MITEVDDELLSLLKEWGLNNCGVAGGSRSELGTSDAVACETRKGADVETALTALWRSKSSRMMRTERRRFGGSLR